jgi:hypothetical protein
MNKKIHSIEEMVKEYNDTILTAEQKFNLKLTKIPLNLARFITFVGKTQINNDEIDSISCMPNNRTKGESFENYKDRQKLQHAMIKYRSIIYNYETPQLIEA